jgi:hypothetical protein
VGLFLNKEGSQEKRRERRQFVVALVALFSVFAIMMATVDAASPVVRNLSGMES